MSKISNKLIIKIVSTTFIFLVGFAFASKISASEIIVDMTPPVITLNGLANITINYKDSYHDQGATVTDDVDGESQLTRGDVIVNTDLASKYITTYTATDKSGKEAIPVTRTVVVKPLSLTITPAAHEKIEGEADPALFNYDVTPGVLQVGDTITGLLSREEGETPGIYKITAGTISAGSNYNITLAPVDFIIKEKPAPEPIPEEVKKSPRRSSGSYIGAYTFTAIQTETKTEESKAGKVLGAEKYNFTLNLGYGSIGEEVKELQKFLNEKGFESGKEDSIFGPITKAAVMRFQIANGLKGDGIVGPLTRAALNK